MTPLQILFQFVGFLLQTAPIAMLAIVPFEDNSLPLPRRRFTIFYILGMVVFSAVYAMISSAIYRPGGEHNALLVLISNLYMVACIAIWITIFFLTIRSSFSKKLLVIIMMIYYAASLFVMTNFFNTILSPVAIDDTIIMYDGFDIIVNLLLLATAPPVMLFLKRIVRAALPHMEGALLRRSNYYVAIALLLFFASVFSLQTFMSVYDFQNPSLLLCLMAFIFTDGILYYMLFSEIRLTSKRREIEDMLRQFDSQYRLISANIDEARRARHDIRHHLNHISTMNHNGEQKALEAYLEAYEASFKQLEAAPLCGYPAFDNILRYYIETANEQDINVSTELHPLRESLGFDVIDVTVMLGNLMENAIQACAALPEGSERFIRVWVKQADAAFLLEIENSCDTAGGEIDEFTDGSFFTQARLPLGHGQGLKSVRFAAEKYGGTSEFKKTGGIFTARVVMNIP